MKAKKYFLETLLPPLLGLSMFVLLWAVLAQTSPNLPDPIKTWHSAVSLFSDPFYIKSPNDQGIGWNILNSLRRVGIGFGMAALVGIPLGFMIGRFEFLDKPPWNRVVKDAGVANGDFQRVGMCPEQHVPERKYDAIV